METAAITKQFTVNRHVLLLPGKLLAVKQNGGDLRSPAVFRVGLIKHRTDH